MSSGSCSGTDWHCWSISASTAATSLMNVESVAKPSRAAPTSNLIKHQIIHSSEMPFMCRVCGKVFRSSFTLLEHAHTHSGERPYECDECGKAFIRSSNLIEHQRTHSGRKPYICQECGKAFKSISHLIHHQCSHRGDRPFACMSAARLSKASWGSANTSGSTAARSPMSAVNAARPLVAGPTSSSTRWCMAECCSSAALQGRGSHVAAISWHVGEASMGSSPRRLEKVAQRSPSPPTPKRSPKCVIPVVRSLRTSCRCVTICHLGIHDDEDDKKTKPVTSSTSALEDESTVGQHLEAQPTEERDSKSSVVFVYAEKPQGPSSP